MVNRVLASNPSILTTLATSFKQQSVPWWLAGGVNPSDVVAVWQPKGASSYADSLVDLTGNGYDAYPGVDPSWTATDGWAFDPTKLQILLTDIYDYFDGWSMICRFSNVGTKSRWNNMIGYWRNSITNFLLTPYHDYGDHLLFAQYGYATSTPGFTDGVMAIAGNNGYYNGVMKASWSTETATKIPFYIGSSENTTKVDSHFDGIIQAAVIYSTTLTAAQVAAITAAMQAL